MWGLARRSNALIPGYREPGFMTAITLAALFRSPKVIVLELIRPASGRSALRRFGRELLFRVLERPLLRRTVIGAQVLTVAERGAYSKAYGITESRIQHVPWPWCMDAHKPAVSRRREGVICSGRAVCDWPTLFAAAEGRDWPLTVVCGKRDLAIVSELNRDNRARVLSEIPKSLHDRLLREAEVCAIVLESHSSSAGHVRLMTATQYRTPVVASDVPPLRGYVVPDHTGLAVPAGDPLALREAIERVLDDSTQAEALARSAFERARQWDYSRYFPAIRRLIDDALDGAKLPATTPLGPNLESEQARSR